MSHSFQSCQGQKIYEEIIPDFWEASPQQDINQTMEYQIDMLKDRLCEAIQQKFIEISSKLDQKDLELEKVKNEHSKLAEDHSKLIAEHNLLKSRLEKLEQSLTKLS